MARTTAVVYLTVAEPPSEDYGWQQSLTSVFIPYGGSFALDSVYKRRPGEVPNWDIVLKEAELTAHGVALVGDALVHDGQTAPETKVVGVQMDSDAGTAPPLPGGGELAFDGAACANPTLPVPYVVDGGPVWILFGKHWSWAATPNESGMFCCWSSDGGYSGSANNGPSPAISPVTV